MRWSIIALEFTKNTLKLGMTKEALASDGYGGMIKLKIVHKGLILVAVPLIFGTAFISLLLYGLSESDRMVQRELMLKDAMMSYITASYCNNAMGGAASSYRIFHDPVYKKYYRSYKQEAQAASIHLRQILDTESWLQNYLHQTPQQVLIASTIPGRIEGTFMRHMRALSVIQTKDAFNAMNALWIILWTGMVLGTLITMALAVFFCLNITNRLLIILNNTVSLSKGNVPASPLAGYDEIAELDQFLFKSATEIKDLERFKKEMIGVVSHELKSPLSSVGGFLSSLSAGVYGELPPKAKDKAERTNNSVKRLMGLVRELLYLDRLELELNPEQVAVDEILAASVDTVKELSEQSGIEIIVRSDGGMVFADRNRLVQVIVNLLSNAMKFSPPQGKVTLETIQLDGGFECRVSDQGRGIPEDFRKQIFEPFKQVDVKDATTKKGTGLGLTISRSIVEQHGGIIGVDSEENKGSTFWFKIPGVESSLQKSIQHPEPLSTPSIFKPQSLQPAHGSEGGRFKVMQQGFVIIAVPLVFQLVFVSVIGCRLNQVSEQTKREESSKDMVDTLNRVLDRLVGGMQDYTMYGFSRNPEAKKRWEANKSATLQLIDHVAKLSADSPEQMRDLKDTMACLDKMSAIAESKNNKVIDAEAFPGLKDAVMKLNGRGRPGSGTLAEIMGSFSSSTGLSTMEMLDVVKARLRELMKVGKDGEESMERVMAREKANGENLSAERSRMIKTLQLTLAAGITLNIGLSILLAVTLMRSLSSRLQHVMENTARLVKRVQLDPPRRGGDEIAYLDRTLYEIGLRLFELESFKRELISIVSHELRTPLLSISAALELFDSGILCDLSEKGKVRLKLAHAECDRLIRLINDLLDIEKMEAGKFVLDKSEIQVEDLIQTSIASVAQLAEPKRIRIQPELSVTETTLLADRDRLCQVLINLLSNAIKFSPDEGVINVTAKSNNSEMEFRVSDQGRGIPEELRQEIFDRFVQVEKSDETIRGGSGLGLAISKAIVEQHGGTIGVESELGKGSTFWFKLPLES